jgi:stage V sporulation protein G
MNEANETKDAITPDAAEKAAPLKLDVRVNPIAPKDNLIGFANVTIADSLVIEGVKVCSGEKDLYVNMPSVQGKDGQWRDVVKPITADCRAQITEAVREGYNAAIEKMQETVKAAKDAARASAARDDAVRESAPEKPSALEALKNGKEQAKGQPAKAPSVKDKSL